MAEHPAKQGAWGKTERVRPPKAPSRELALKGSVPATVEGFDGLESGESVSLEIVPPWNVSGAEIFAAAKASFKAACDRSGDDPERYLLEMCIDEMKMVYRLRVTARRNFST